MTLATLPPPITYVIFLTLSSPIPNPISEPPQASSSPSFHNCTFRKNQGTDGTPSDPASGAITLDGVGTPTVEGCLFADNGMDSSLLGHATSAGCTGHGAAVWVGKLTAATVSSCLFKRNSAAQGGGVAVTSSIPAVITNCSFEKNQAFEGGGVHVAMNSSCNVGYTSFKASPLYPIHIPTHTLPLFQGVPYAYTYTRHEYILPVSPDMSRSCLYMSRSCLYRPVILCLTVTRSVTLGQHSW